MPSQFPPPDSDAIRRHILDLGRRAVDPASGAERHFLKVLAGEARWSSQGERAWVDYWHAHRDDSPNSARSVTPKTRREPISPIDLAVVATNIGANIASVEQVAANPLLKQAIEMTTNQPLADFASSPEALQGAINTAKGKYFELLVEEKLNQGETIGDVSLAAGHKAALAESMNQPGWDIAITDDHQRLVEAVQLKATDSVSYIKDTLERYPDIKIVTTSEAVHGTAHGDMVIDSGISNHDIEQVVGRAIDDLPAGFIGSFIDTFNPLLPLIFIVATEGFKVSLGKASVEQALDAAATRAKHSVTGGAVGALFYAMGFGWFSIIPAVLAAKAGPEGLANALEGTYDSIVAWYQRKVDEAEAALPDTYKNLAVWLNEKARSEGIKATFTSKQIAKAIGATRTGIGLLDHVSDGWIAYDIYNAHPAVKKHKADYHDKRLEEAKAYFLAKLKAEEARRR